LGLTAEQVRLAFRRIAPHGLRRHTFTVALADVRQVIRDITLTSVFEIKAAKKVRKLALGELLEATGPSQEDSNLDLERLPCRAILDGAEGWVTVKSKAGTQYVKQAERPCLWCSTASPLQKAAEEDSGVVCQMETGEVVELLEGPKEGRPAELRVRGTACQEEGAGWLHVQNSKGEVTAQLSDKLYKCVEPIAMTEEFDFAKCTMVRRIEAGEALELLPQDASEAPPADGAAQRRRFKACLDGKEGWVTMNGNRGKIYLKHAEKHYVCLKETPVHSGLGAESAVVRVLMAGEAFAALDEPRKVSGGEQFNVYKVRTMNDTKEGWVTSSTTELQIRPWSRRYKVLKPVPLTGGFHANEAAEIVEVLRLLETDELLDIAEHPTPDTSSGHLRLRCVAVRDKLVGWATVRESAGAELNVRPVAAGEEGALPTAHFTQAAPEPEQEEKAVKKPQTVKPPPKAAGAAQTVKPPPKAAAAAGPAGAAGAAGAAGNNKRPAAFQGGQNRPPAGFDGSKRWKGSGKGGAWPKW